MPTPHLTPSSPSHLPKLPINLHSALTSTLRIWLVTRDTALWPFVAGVSTTSPIEDIRIEDSRPAIDEMNRLRRLCLSIADQIVAASPDRNLTSASVISTSISLLLATESPSFLLSIPSLPTSF